MHAWVTVVDGWPPSSASQATPQHPADKDAGTARTTRKLLAWRPEDRKAVAFTNSNASSWCLEKVGMTSAASELALLANVSANVSPLTWSFLP
jgi:hypothetical protein